MISGSAGPALVVAFTGQNIALLLSICVACMAIVDYGFKLHWKVKQARERKKGHAVKLTHDEYEWLQAHRTIVSKGK
jgi:hypothetical protein